LIAGRDLLEVETAISPRWEVDLCLTLQPHIFVFLSPYLCATRVRGEGTPTDQVGRMEAYGELKEQYSRLLALLFAVIGSVRGRRPPNGRSCRVRLL
jgi:hypothetical protein